jgi:hypothetical protein
LSLFILSSRGARRRGNPQHVNLCMLMDSSHHAMLAAKDLSVRNDRLRINQRFYYYLVLIGNFDAKCLIYLT